MSKDGMGSRERGLYRTDLQLEHFFQSHGDSSEDCSRGEIGPLFWNDPSSSRECGSRGESMKTERLVKICYKSR